VPEQLVVRRLVKLLEERVLALAIDAVQVLDLDERTRHSAHGERGRRQEAGGSAHLERVVVVRLGVRRLHVVLHHLELGRLLLHGTQHTREHEGGGR